MGDIIEREGGYILDEVKDTESIAHRTHDTLSATPIRTRHDGCEEDIALCIYTPKQVGELEGAVIPRPFRDIRLGKTILKPRSRYINGF